MHGEQLTSDEDRFCFAQLTACLLSYLSLPDMPARLSIDTLSYPDLNIANWIQLT